MKLLSLLAIGNATATFMSDRTGYSHEEESMKQIRELCPCADSSLKTMGIALEQYQTDQRYNPGKTSVDELVSQIKQIAFECTSRPECRCPEGYFKTRDGRECLKLSSEPADCITAEKACSNDFNSRLAIAKDADRLDKLAGIMEELGEENAYYWIGLSYNKTVDTGDADWRWSDGNKATGEMVENLNMSLKKSGSQRPDTRMLDIDLNDGYPIERVAISSQNHGKFWKHESCRAKGLTGPPKHNYICEFMLFKVRINAEKKSGQLVGKIGEF
jgi:hypothetical protein